jgi:hypothetical protein
MELLQIESAVLRSGSIKRHLVLCVGEMQRLLELRMPLLSRRAEIISEKGSEIGVYVPARPLPIHDQKLRGHVAFSGGGWRSTCPEPPTDADACHIGKPTEDDGFPAHSTL